MRTNILLPLALIVLGFTACEKVINVDIKPEPSKLVMNAVVAVSDTIRMSLSRSLTIAESGKGIGTNITGATVVLYIDGAAADTLQANNDGIYISRYTAQAGRVYRLQATAKGYASIEATATAPGPVPLSTIEYAPGKRRDAFGNTQDELTIGFTDPPPAGDHYIIHLSPVNESDDSLDFYSYGYSACINTSDPAVESYTSAALGEEDCLSGNAIFVRDVLFNGQERSIRLYVPAGMMFPGPDSNSGQTIYARVYLYNVTESFYKYVKSYLGARENTDNPFAEPSNVITNVRGGYGVFSIVYSNSREVIF